MRFEWDEDKSQANIQKPGLDFADAPQMFAVPMLVILDNREDYGEDRWFGIGTLKSHSVVVLFTESEDDVIRIISLRKALNYERTRYEEFLQDELGSD